MSASRTRWGGLVALALAVVTLVTGCGGGNTPSTPATSSSPTASRPTTSPTSKSPFTNGLVVENCYVEGGVGKLRLSDFTSDGEESAARTLTDLNNTASCDNAPGRSAFTDDFMRVYVTHSNESADQTSVVGYVDINQDVFKQLTKSGGDFQNVSEKDPTLSQKDGRVYFYDVSGDDPVLKSMTLNGSDVRTEPALQKQFSDTFTFGNTDIYPYIVPNANRLIIDNNKPNSSVYSADGSLHALYDSTTGELSVEKNGQATTYQLKYTTKQPETDGTPTLGGFIDDRTLVYSDGAQIYRASLSSGTATLTPILTNTSKRVIDQVVLSADGTRVAFVYALRGGLGIMSQTTDLYTVPISGGTPTKLHSYSGVALQGSVRILQFH